MSRHLAYLSYVLRHKWFVLVEGLKLDVPLINLLIHDWDKFRPDEWIPYVNHFHGDRREKWEKSTGYIHMAGKDETFDLACDMHTHRNKHHWQWWIFKQNGGSEVVRPMDDVSRREMLADWRGAGRAQGTPDVARWYWVNSGNVVLHPDTRAWIENQMSHQLAMLEMEGRPPEVAQ